MLVVYDVSKKDLQASIAEKSIYMLGCALIATSSASHAITRDNVRAGDAGI